MFLRILILFFAINSLIPSATAFAFVNVGSAPSNMMVNAMSDTDSVAPIIAMNKNCTMGDSCTMDMDSSCDLLHCSSAYVINNVAYFAFLQRMSDQPQFVLTHFYHIVHPVHTPPPLT